MVFSVREAEQLHRRAVAKAWHEIEVRMRDFAAQNPATKVELVQVSYDPSPGESIIEELPDQPKSSRPKEVQVSVRLRATYVQR